MFESGLFPFGIILSITGVIFLLLIWVVLRIIPKIHPLAHNEGPNPISPEIPSHQDAVILVKSGGLVSYLNDETRNLFELWDDHPNLEQMARNSRPADLFLGLCAAEGHARFSINGQWVEGSSYIYPGTNDYTVLVSLRPQKITNISSAEKAFSAHTLNILTDLNQQLGSMETRLILETLIDSAMGVVQSADAGVVLLWDADSNLLHPKAAKGFPGEGSIFKVLHSPIDSVTGQVFIKGESILLKDINFAEDFNLVLDNLINYRDATDGKLPLSSMIVPIQSGETVFGLIILDNFELAGAFNTEDQALIESLARQTALALENANLYQQSLQRTDELDKRTQRLALLNRFSNNISSTLNMDELFQVILTELQHAIPGTTISAVRSESSSYILHCELPIPDQELPLQLPTAPVFDQLRDSLGVFSTQDALQEKDIAPLKEYLVSRRTQALLILPLAISEVFFGFIIVHAHQPRRFTTDEIELGRTITNQASVAIQNASLFEETHRLTEELEHRVAERTEQLEHEHRRTQTLLQIMQELSGSLDLGHVLNRTLALLNETTGAQQSTILLLRPSENTFYYRASLGHTTHPPSGGHLSALPLDEGLAEQVINHRDGTLIDDLHRDSRWIGLLDGNSEYRSVIAVPLMVGEEALGSMLLFHREPEIFTSEHRELVQAAANQIAVAINNHELFNLIREQAESLASMLRTQQIEASRSMSILEAVADGVLVTDSHNIITLFNQSAQEILDLNRESIVGNSLDNFTGIFGGVARSWTETIHEWAKDPSVFESGDTYAERITLDNNRVVSIHLAPVVMRNEFLGTVSVFRDITHQVAVDRLKSEFVATVSHELRTPMTSIKGYVEVLLMGAGGPLNDQQASFLQVVKTNTERLNILVNDLLDVSRIEAGKVTLSIQPLNIGELAREVINEQLRQSEEDKKPMNIDLEIAPDFPRVPGDPERVRQIIGNLVSNAFNYTPSDGQITIMAHIVGDEAQIDVKDNGIGIKPQDGKKIFERFYRGENPLVLACSGNGLGLSITQQLIEMHHGRIWMKSNGIPGDGSVFSFTLPLHVRDEINKY